MTGDLPERFCVASICNEFKGKLIMPASTPHTGDVKAWVEPEIRQLDVLETFAFINVGADVGGNPTPDCQRS